MVLWKMWAVVVSGPLLALASSPAAEASSTEPVKAGWWSTTSIGGAAVIPPDVPADGLLVQGGSADPTAYAAVTYDIPLGSVPAFLTLKVATASVTLPSAALRACPLTADFQPVRAGDMAAAPAYDCATFVAGSVSSDGTSVTLDVSELRFTDQLALALLPGGPSDRIVLEGPTTSLLELGARPSPSTTGGPPAPAVPSVAPVDDAGSGTSGDGTAVSPSVGVLPQTGPASDAAPGPAVADAEPTPQLAALPQAATTSIRSTRHGFFGWLAAGLGFAVVLLWRLAGTDEGRADLSETPDPPL